MTATKHPSTRPYGMNGFGSARNWTDPSLSDACRYAVFQLQSPDYIPRMHALSAPR